MDRPPVLMTVAVVVTLVVFNLSALNNERVRVGVVPSALPVVVDEAADHTSLQTAWPETDASSQRADAGVVVGPLLASPRLARYNNYSAIEWPPRERKRREQLLSPVIAHCGNRTRSGLGQTRRRRSQRRVRAVGVDDWEAGRWNRFWAIVECKPHRSNRGSWEPCCNSGDVVDVQLESPQSKVAVSRVFNIANDGIYEIHVFLRKRHEAYRLGLDLRTSGLTQLSDFSLVDPTIRKRFPRGPHRSKYEVCHPPYPNGTVFITVAVQRGENIVPMDRPCTNAKSFSSQDLKDRFRYGAWFRLPSTVCDGVHCDGDTQWLNTEGWVWVSDLCRVQLFAPDVVARDLHNKSIFGWGASTLNQPLNIFYSEMIRSPDERRSNPPLWWAWSGCVNPSERLYEQCRIKGYGIGFSTWKSVGERLFKERSYQFVLVERMAWLTDNDDAPLYFTELSEWLSRYRKQRDALYAGATAQPVQIFHSGGALENSALHGPCGSVVPYGTHMNWAVEDFMAANAPEFFFVSRYEMTLPLHFGTMYVQARHHYGSTAKSCKKKLMERNMSAEALATYGGNNCVRRVHGDAAVVTAWINIWLSQ